ncbi:MAG: hypothetical protein DLM73_10020 [Chthoniobacterales bacterium]|nr:MAG: hypothetical protein DLM73_10020 [Chthoniobacterales bacterium]
MRPLILFIALIGATGSLRAEPVSLLGGKLKLETTDTFVAEKKPTSSKQSIADFKARKSDAWGAILRGTHGLQPDGLKGYMDRKVAEYTKGMAWLPRLDWLKKEIVTIDGRQWADMRYIAPREKAKDPRDGLLYTRILATSYGGQLLEITFTSNTDENPALKDKIDQLMASVKLTE